MNGQNLQVVGRFTNLGNTLSRAVHIDDEVTARTAKASVAIGRLRVNVLERNGTRLDTKLKVYMDVVLSTLLYALDGIPTHAKRLGHCYLSYLRKLLKLDGRIPRHRGPEEGKEAKRTCNTRSYPFATPSRELICLQPVWVGKAWLGYGKSLIEIQSYE